MTTSKILTKTAGDIIEEALRSAKIIASEQPVEAVDYQNGIDALNNISKYWQAQGTHQWLIERAILPLIPGQETYLLGPGGAKCAYRDNFYSTTLSAAAATSDVTLTVTSTSGMAAAPDILDTDPTDSTQDWTAINSATLAVSSGLKITNVSSTAGGADYSLDTTIGQTYRVRFSYTLGTSASCVFSVLNGDTVEDTVTLSASADGDLEITATTDTITFRAQNSSTTIGQYSTVYDLEYVDTETGSEIGIVLDSGSREWGYVYTVDSSTSVTLTAGISGAAASGNSVYSYTEGISRPLALNNMMFGSSISVSEIPVMPWSRQEYFNQPDKDSQGTVVNWHYTPKLSTGTLYVWQTASNIANVLTFDCRIPMSVYSSTSDEIDFSEEYYQALKWAIAAEVGPDYGVSTERQLVLEQKAAAFLAQVLDNDSEDDSMYFQPDFT